MPPRPRRDRAHGRRRRGRRGSRRITPRRWSARSAVQHEELRGEAAEDYPADWEPERAAGSSTSSSTTPGSCRSPADRRRAGRAGARRWGHRHHVPGGRPLLHRGRARHEPPARGQRGAVRDRAPLRPRPGGARRSRFAGAGARPRARAVHGRDAALRGPPVAGDPRRLRDPHGARHLELSRRGCSATRGARDRPRRQRRGRLDRARDPARGQARRLTCTRRSSSRLTPQVARRCRRRPGSDRTPPRCRSPLVLGAPRVASYREPARRRARSPAELAPELRAWLTTPAPRRARRAPAHGPRGRGALFHAWWQPLPRPTRRGRCRRAPRG